MRAVDLEGAVAQGPVLVVMVVWMFMPSVVGLWLVIGEAVDVRKAGAVVAVIAPLVVMLALVSFSTDTSKESAAPSPKPGPMNMLPVLEYKTNPCALRLVGRGSACATDVHI